MIHCELLRWEYFKHLMTTVVLYLWGPSPSYILPVCKHERRKEAWIYSIFYLPDVAVQAAGAFVAQFDWRNHSILLIWQYTGLFYFLFVLCLSLSYDRICIFIRGGKPLWPVDYCRLCCTPHHQVTWHPNSSGHLTSAVSMSKALGNLALFEGETLVQCSTDITSIVCNGTFWKAKLFRGNTLRRGWVGLFLFKKRALSEEAKEQTIPAQEQEYFVSQTP